MHKIVAKTPMHYTPQKTHPVLSNIQWLISLVSGTCTSISAIGLDFSLAPCSSQTESLIPVATNHQ